MMVLALAILQSAAPLPPADIELRARVTARSLTIEKKGEARVTVMGNGQNVVDVRAPKANGRTRIANPAVTVDIEARVADPLDEDSSTSTPPR
jgi:hypothetical protein